MILPIFPADIDGDYHGCGKAWVGIDSSGVVRRIRYMEPQSWHVNLEPSAAAVSLRVVADTLGGQRKRSPAWARHMARIALRDEAWAAYRVQCRRECGAVGEVRSALISCWEAITTR